MVFVEFVVFVAFVEAADVVVLELFVVLLAVPHPASTKDPAMMSEVANASFLLITKTTPFIYKTVSQGEPGDMLYPIGTFSKKHRILN